MNALNNMDTSYVPGQHGKDVYVLTSRYLFLQKSLPILKAAKRATIIGETTGGGANPGFVSGFNDHFGMFVATGRSQLTKRTGKNRRPARCKVFGRAGTKTA